MFPNARFSLEKPFIAMAIIGALIVSWPHFVTANMPFEDLVPQPSERPFVVYLRQELATTLGHPRRKRPN